MAMITIKDDVELKAYIDSLNDNQLSALFEMIRCSVTDRLLKPQKNGNFKKANTISFSVDEQLQAKEIIDHLDFVTLTFIVQHMFLEHSDVILPMMFKGKGGNLKK